MTRDEAIGAYCRQTGRVLAAPKDRREELLAGLRQELEERFSGAEELTEGALYQQVGPPRETAEALLESVPTRERARYRAQRELWTRVLVILMAVVTAASLVYAAYTWPTGGTAIITTTHYESVPEDFPTGGQGTVEYHYND